MFSLLKALIPATLLTWVVASVIGTNGSSGGFLNIHRVDPMGIEFFWTWPLFVASLLLSAAIFQSMK